MKFLGWHACCRSGDARLQARAGAAFCTRLDAFGGLLLLSLLLAEAVVRQLTRALAIDIKLVLGHAFAAATAKGQIQQHWSL